MLTRSKLTRSDGTGVNASAQAAPFLHCLPGNVPSVKEPQIGECMSRSLQARGTKQNV